jgi:hypothetical protein
MRGRDEMNEDQYIKATNRAKVTMALTIMRDILPSSDDKWGVTDQELSEATEMLRKMEVKLFASVQIDD